MERNKRKMRNIKKQVRPVLKNYTLTITEVRQETSTGFSGSEALIPTGSSKLVKSKERHYPTEANVIVKNKTNYGKNV